jgi:hypothetical protein
MQEGKELVP